MQQDSIQAYVIPFEQLGIRDIERVGGKNASLGEMIQHLSHAGVRVPGGFATTAQAYRDFIFTNALDKRIDALLSKLDIEDVAALAETGATIRRWIVEAPFTPRLKDEIAAHYQELAAAGEGTFAVRSSATAEDLPDASFAGQQETFLNIHGLDNVLHAIKEVYASLYNDRAIAYRVHKGFNHAGVALSAGVQKMVRSDLGSAGVMFSMDTESGFRHAVFITASWGLGETVVQGAVNPDEYYVHKHMLGAAWPAVIRRSLGSKRVKMVFADDHTAGSSTRTVETTAEEAGRFTLSDSEVRELARYAVAIEKHYGRAMDIEWGKDGIDGKLYILQARPETVKSQEASSHSEKFHLLQRGNVLVTGRAIGQKIGAGTVRVIEHARDMGRVQPGDILVTDMTDPNWEPVMKRAAAIVTNRGGRTCHAAIIARELGVPAMVGCNDATTMLQEGMQVTVSCAEGDTGRCYDGILDFDITYTSTASLPPPPVKIMMNVGNPELAFEFAQIPNAGVGLARLEFVISNTIGIHPKAILQIDKVPEALREKILRRAQGYAGPKEFYVEKLVEGVSTIAAAFWPKPVIVRLSDFKSNEYRMLLGGDLFEPEEENPMLGFRGAARYVSSTFNDCFALECRAMKRVRDEMGYTNVELMVPFVRTLTEARDVTALMAIHGLRRDDNGLRIIMMCEVPSNAILAEEFLHYFDGFSIGSNDLTQLTLGVDRDSGLVANSFDERDIAVKRLLATVIATCNQKGKYVGICGQGPSDHPDFAQWLMDAGIQSMSLNPDTVIDTWIKLAASRQESGPETVASV